MNPEKHFNEKEKDKLLMILGWEKLEGYVMGYEPPETDNVIISVKEIQACIGKAVEVYYFPKGDGEYLRDLDDAWECLEENIYDELDTKEDSDVIKFLKDKLLTLKSKNLKEEK